jgi:hypothetical protein
METPAPRQQGAIPARPARDRTPRRLIVTASIVAFAICDWTLWILLRDGPWGPPMRLVLGTESVSDGVDRIMEALFMWPEEAALLRLKSGWQEQQVSVWGSSEQGAAVSLVHCILLRANRNELRPNLHMQPVPSLHVSWMPVVELEGGQKIIDADVLPGVLAALYTLRSRVQRDPEIVLRYLADMSTMNAVMHDTNWWQQDMGGATGGRETMPLKAIRAPAVGDGILTLAEATLLYRAFFAPEEQIDLSNLRRRFLGTNKLEAMNEERPVRGKELDWRRVSRAYRYLLP